MWNGVPAPARVTPSRCSTGIVVAGSKASMTTVLKPTIIELNSQPIPPMCVNGNTSALTSPGSIASAFVMPYADAMIVRSVCCAPFGSAVVPDV